MLNCTCLSETTLLGFKDTFPDDGELAGLIDDVFKTELTQNKQILTELKKRQCRWFLNPFGSNQRKHDDENIEKLLYKNTFTKEHSFMTFRSRFSQEILLILLNMILNRNIRKLIIYYRIVLYLPCAFIGRICTSELLLSDVLFISFWSFADTTHGASGNKIEKN